MTALLRWSLFLFTVCLFSAQAVADKPRRGFQPRHLMVQLGAMDADEGDYKAFDNTGEEVEADEIFGTIPMGGILVQLADGPSTFEYGIETGAYFGWKDIDTKYASSSDGRLLVKVNSAFYMFEILLGGFVGLNVTDNFRLYAGAGPSVVYGHMSGDDNFDGSTPPDDERGLNWADSQSDLALGLYGRVGMEYRIGKKLVLGVAARYLDSELDFSDGAGEVDLKGPQYFLTIGRRY